jgi:magnesium chelatase subunit D
MHAHLPFPALVGLDLAQRALILLAIDPELRGVAIAAPVGTGKSSLARGIRQVIGDETPFVEVPPSVDIENLLGGLDLEATLRTGNTVLQRGVLAKAHGGIAYVDGLNLLADGSANLMLSVLDEGEVRIEREGISRREDARFSLIGTYDPAEGVPRQHLLDRVGLIVTVQGISEVKERESVLRRNLMTDAETWGEDLDFMRGLILTAREQLPTVTITDEQIQQLSVTAVAYGVQGQRTDLFAVRAACAAAASEMRDTVEAEDMELAMRLVILPRATQIPVDQPEQAPPPPPPPESDATETEASTEPPPAQEQESSDDDQAGKPAPEDLVQPEQVLEALSAALPEELDQLPFRNLRRGRAGSRGSTDGKRGRHIRSVPGDPRQAPIDITGTLRAAAPWQQVRRRNGNGGDRRVQLTPSDIRVKQYRTKAGALFCFAVDASGSMALHRMQQAKGAVNTLLEQAYVNRDRISLIAFRGEQAELLMPPTQSVELARRSLDVLPTGGGTPLTSALLLALDVAEQAKSRGIYQTVLILLTDGRGNIAFRDGADPRTELEQIGAVIAESSLRVMVVDTKRSYLSRGEARELAGWLGADYAYLPNADSGQIAGIAKEAIASD